MTGLPSRELFVLSALACSLLGTQAYSLFCTLDELTPGSSAIPLTAGSPGTGRFGFLSHFLSPR